MTETKLNGLTIHNIDSKETYDALVAAGLIGENDLALVKEDASAFNLGITGANVGDIIKVKAVDADGKPTEWEAAEMSSGYLKDTEMTITGDATNAVLEFSGIFKRMLVCVDTSNSESLGSETSNTFYCGFNDESTYAGYASKYKKGQKSWFEAVYIGDGKYNMFEWVGSHFYAENTVVCVPLGLTSVDGVSSFKINQYGSVVNLNGITVTAYRVG